MGQNQIGHCHFVAHKEWSSHVLHQAVYVSFKFPFQAGLDVCNPLVFGKHKAMAGCHPKNGINFVINPVQIRVLMRALNRPCGIGQRIMTIRQKGHDCAAVGNHNVIDQKRGDLARGVDCLCLGRSCFDGI